MSESEEKDCTECEICEWLAGKNPDFNLGEFLNNQKSFEDPNIQLSKEDWARIRKMLNG